MSVIGITLLGSAKAQLGDLDAAEPLVLEALARARRTDQSWIEARCLEFLGTFAMARGDMPVAETQYQAALQVARSGLDPWSEGMALNSMADFLRARGEYEKAGPLYEEALELFYTLDLRRYTPQGLIHNLGYVALARGELQRAAQLFLESGNEYRSVGNDRRGLAECAIGLACTATRAGQLPLAARLFGSAEATIERLGVAVTPSNQTEYERGLGELHRVLGPQELESERMSGRTWSLDDALTAARPLVDEPDRNRRVGAPAHRRPHPAGARSRRAPGARPHQSRARRAAGHLRKDRQEPRPARPGKARRPLPSPTSLPR